MGVKIDLDEIEIMEERPLQNEKSLVGYLRSAVWSLLAFDYLTLISPIID